jgi:16S rRNA C967 or C1407 C5-methylase (RsmB/RsmF family)
VIPADFHAFYQFQYEHRWPGLFEAMRTSGPRCHRMNVFADMRSASASLMQKATEIPGLRGCYLPEQTVEPTLQMNQLFDFYCMDPASVLPAMALETKPGDRVLDMCAAPGGKSLILAEALAQGGRMVVNEWSRQRNARLRHVLKSYLPEFMHKQIQVTTRDASKWGLHEPNTYDRVLLDAPCSSERHLIHREKAIRQWKTSRSKHLARRQFPMICAAIMACKPQGRVVYSTCSLSTLENDENIRRLCRRKGDLFTCRRDLHFPYGEKTEFGWQILPDHSPGWGPMFWSVLERR